MKTELVVATRNKKKLKEIKQIFKDLPVRISSLSDYPRSPRIIENGSTFRANAEKKATKIAKFTKKLTLGEDSGLEVDALGGRPGVCSSRFAGAAKSDSLNNKKLLRLLKGLPAAKRKARYQCSVAIADQRGVLAVVQGACCGEIGFEPKGSFGFGYDPLFIIKKYNQTFAQLGPRIKHKISHRYRALSKVKKSILTYLKRNP